MATTQNTCHMCGGAGALLSPQGKLIPCACQEQTRMERRSHRLAEASSFVPEMRQQTFHTFDHTTQGDVFNAVAAWCGWNGFTLPYPWLLLTGAPGTGKTHMLAAATNELHRQGHPALYVLAPDLLDYLRAGIRVASASDDTRARLRLLREVPYLILDELGKEAETDYACEQLFQLLDYRYRRGACTLFASNLSENQCPDYLASRLSDVAICQIVPMRPGDYRLTERPTPTTTNHPTPMTSRGDRTHHAQHHQPTRR